MRVGGAGSVQGRAVLVVVVVVGGLVKQNSFSTRS